MVTERHHFLSLIFSLCCMHMRVCVFNHFVHVSIFTLTHVLFKVITFIIYFILILLLPILLKKWGFKIQKIQRKIIQKQNEKSRQKEYQVTSTIGISQRHQNKILLQNDSVFWLYWLLSVGYHYFAPHTSTICKYRMRITLLEKWLGGIMRLFGKIVIVQSLKKVYKTFHFSSIFYCLFCDLFIKSHSKK